MPYTIDKPPDAIKALPKHAQEIWIAAFNSSFAQTKNEGRSHAIAWSGVKNKFHQDAKGNWIAKSDYGDFIMNEAQKILPQSWYSKIQQAARAYAGGKAYKPNREHATLMKLSPDTLKAMKDAQIEKLHARVHTLHKCTPTTSDVHSVGYVKLKNLKKFHGWVAKELSRRQMAHDVMDELDSNMVEKYSDEQPRDEQGRFGEGGGGGGGGSSKPASRGQSADTKRRMGMDANIQRAEKKISQLTAASRKELKGIDKLSATEAKDAIKRAKVLADKATKLRDSVKRYAERNYGLEYKSADEPDDLTKSFDVTFIAKADEQQIAYGVVYEPDTVDSQGDWASAAEIEKAAHRFLELYRQMDVNHDGNVRQDIVPVESYLAPVDFEMGEPPQKVLKGSWVVGVHAGSPETWQDIKSDKLSGLSMFGLAHRKDGTPGVPVVEADSKKKEG